MLKTGFNPRVGNRRSSESSVCEDNIIEKTCLTYLKSQKEFTDENWLIYAFKDIKYQTINICRMSLYTYRPTFGIIVKACEFKCVPFTVAE